MNQREFTRGLLKSCTTRREAAKRLMETYHHPFATAQSCIRKHTTRYERAQAWFPDHDNLYHPTWGPNDDLRPPLKGEGWEEPAAPEPKEAPKKGFVDIDPEFVLYDAEKDIYRTWLKCRKGVMEAVTGEDVREAKKMYSRWPESGEEATINQVCQHFNWPRAWFVEFKSRMGWTHDQDPFTDEEHKVKSLDTKLQSLIMMERDALESKNAARRFKEIQKDAMKWRQFNTDVIEPVRKFIADKPPRAYVEKMLPPDSTFGRKKMILVAPQDLHIEKLSWDGSQGIDETRMMLLTSTRELIARATKGLHEEDFQIALILGSDWWNSDNEKGETPRGTPQDNDGNPYSGLVAGLDLQIELIDELRSWGFVNVFMVPGNHDQRTCQVAHWGLQQGYAASEDVFVHSSCDDFQYHEFGKCMFGFHHGHGLKGGRKARPKEFLAMMAKSEPKMWGRTEWRYQIGGHYHGIDVVDEGITYIQTRSLSADDRWHRLKGYTLRDRGQDIFVFDEEEGLINTYTKLVRGPG